MNKWILFLLCMASILSRANAKDQSAYATDLTVKNCYSILTGSGFTFDEESSALAKSLEFLDFPPAWNVHVNNREAREAIFNAFGGRDFYTGTKITIEEMVIDHIIPSARGGPNNFYNYVPTTNFHNVRKTDKIDPKSILAILTLVRTAYVDKVIENYQAARSSSPRRIRIKKSNEMKANLAKKISFNSWTFLEWSAPSDAELNLWGFIYDQIIQNPELDTNPNRGIEITFPTLQAIQVFGQNWEDQINVFYRNRIYKSVVYTPAGPKARGAYSFCHSMSIVTKNENSKPLTVKEQKEVDSFEAVWGVNPREAFSSFVDEQPIDTISLRLDSVVGRLIKTRTKEEFLQLLKWGLVVDPYLVLD